MTVMEVGAVAVRVFQRLVLVPVRVHHRRAEARMLVEMMAVVVAVAVGVREQLVGMEVLVAIAKNERDGRGEENARDDMRGV
jgi:hypothetical protein